MTESSSESKRRHFTGPEKVRILKRHLVEKVPVSDLCDEYKLYPTQLDDWLKDFFENGHLSFEAERKPRFEPDTRDQYRPAGVPIGGRSG